MTWRRTTASVICGEMPYGDTGETEHRQLCELHAQIGIKGHMEYEQK